MEGPKLAVMGWRNLWRNKRRTLITLSAIAFGAGLAVIFTGLGDYTYGNMIDMAAKLGGGHVTVQHPEYLELPSLNRTVTDTKKKAEVALSDPGVKKVVTRITGSVMLSTAGESFGAGFIAFDPQAEDENTFALIDDIIEGEMFKTSRDKGIILGTQLAKNLGAKMGKKVVYTVTDRSGEISSGLARVSGIVSAGSPSIDLGLCLLPMAAVAETLGYEPGEATQVAIFISDQRDADKVRKRLAPLFEPESAVHIWKETQPDLSSFVTMKVAGANFFETVIMLLVAAGIFNTLFISVMERLREFGILMAIGFSPWSLFRLVMWESLWLGLCGLVAAAIVWAWPYHYFNTVGLDMSGYLGEEQSADIAGIAFEPVMKVAIYPENLFIICSLVILATLLSGLYPAWRAGHVEPVETIRLV